VLLAVRHHLPAVMADAHAVPSIYRAVDRRGLISNCMCPLK
jgi:hypothetical protein